MGLSDLKTQTLGAGLLPLLNLVTLLDSVTLGFWTLTEGTRRLQTPAPYFYPPFPKQKGSWSLISKRLPHN